MQFDSFIFDLDGTLWNSCKTVTDAWNDGLQRLNISKTLTISDVQSTMGLKFEDIFDKLFPEFSREEQKKIGDFCEIIEAEYIQERGGILYSGVLDLIPKLSEFYQLYIVSNCQKGYIESFLAYSKLTPYFKDHECYGNTQKVKGHNILSIIERNHLKSALYIGDTQSDADACVLAQVPMSWAKWGFGKNIKAQFEYDTFWEFAGYFCALD